MSINRRQFVTLTMLALAGCTGGGADQDTGLRPGEPVDAGPAAVFANDGVYTQFRNRGFFIVRAAGKLLVLSSFCTHRHCRLKFEPDHTFLCPCHGSVFDPTGKVTHGPANRDLPTLAWSIDSTGHLIVQA